MKITALLLSLMMGTSAQAYYYYPYTFSEVATELNNVSSGTIFTKSGLHPGVDKTTFQLVGVTFYTWENPSGIDPVDYFGIDIPKFNTLMEAPDFLEAKQIFYSRLYYSKWYQRYYRPYSYLESWRSLAHPHVKKLDVPLTTIDRRMTPYAAGERAREASPYYDVNLQREIDAMSSSELTIGNNMDIIVDNDAFERKLDLIRRAKKSFIGMVMVLACDRNGTRFVDELIKAKNRGVDVKVMHETVWTKITNAGCVKKMKNNGIDVHLISDMISNHFSLGVVHNKFWIRDEEEAIIGGQNLVDAETESDGFNAKGHDTEVWIRSGPEVSTLQFQYANLWHRYAKGDQRERINQYLANAESRMRMERELGLRGPRNYEAWLSNPETRMKGICRSIVQKYGKEDLIGPVLQRYAEVATSMIQATTPNVKYHNKAGGSVINNLLNTLTAKADEGVQVDVIANGIDGTGGALGDWFREAISEASHSTTRFWSVPFLKTIYRISGLAVANSDLKQLTRFQNSSENIRAWTYTSFIHAKAMVYDRKLVSIGSFNLDHHSAHTNHEAQMFCLDEKLAEQSDALFTRDLANSVPVR